MLAKPMTRMKHIRVNVLGIRQGEMAMIARVSQGTVCKWEKNELEPGLTELALIRDAARSRGVDWDDRWFFEPPLSPERAEQVRAPESGALWDLLAKQARVG
jgi:transcriptional regulator with XRE-family HTH domain